MNDFVELKEFPGYYIAHSPARLRRNKKGKIYDCYQTPNSKQDNYWTVTVKTKSGKYVKRNMHRLLMQTFVPNPQNKAHVNHIDGDKSNNELYNLEWATPRENSQHAVRMGLSTSTWAEKEVHQYTLAGVYVNSFINDSAAQKATGIPKQNISKVTLGNRIHAGYFQWTRLRYIEIPPVTKKYIKGYKVKNKFFTTLKELALYIGHKDPEKVDFLRLQAIISKQYRLQIKKVFYD